MNKIIEAYAIPNQFLRDKGFKIDKIELYESDRFLRLRVLWYSDSISDMNLICYCGNLLYSSNLGTTNSAVFSFDNYGFREENKYHKSLQGEPYAILNVGIENTFSTFLYKENIKWGANFIFGSRYLGEEKLIYEN